MKVHGNMSISCDHCEKAFQSKQALHAHLGNAEQNKCNICNENFKYKSSFKRHIKSKHITIKNLVNTLSILKRSKNKMKNKNVISTRILFQQNQI